MKHILFILLLLINHFLHGKSNDSIVKKSIGIRTGYIQYIESNIHPKVFSGVNYIFDYNATWQRKNLFSLDVAIGNSHLKTNIENSFSSISAIISLDYNYLFPVTKSNRWDIHTGLGTRLNYNTGYFWIWDESHLYWANFLGFNFRQRFSYETQRENRIIGTFSIPVFMFLSRPEIERNFKMDDFSFGGIMRSLHYSPEAKFFTQALCLNGTLEYQYKRKRKILPFLSYTFNYFNLKTSYSSNTQSIQHLIGLKWNL